MKILSWIIKYWIAIVVIILMISFFFPKSYVKGGLHGFIGPGQREYKEEYLCFGIKHSFQPSMCDDCGSIYNCYGILYDKKCYMESYSSEGMFSKDITACK